MKTAVVYYSFTGKTAKIAKEKAIAVNADLIELKDTKRLGKLNAYVLGTYKAMKQKKTNLQPISIDFDQYDRILIAMPVWASMPAPAINNLIDMLPPGKQVEVILSSSSGKTKDASVKIEERLKAKGCLLIKTTDIKTAN